MDFTFTDQQLEFRDAIRRFLVVEAAPELLREYWETPTGRSKAMRGKLAEQGLTALSVPEEYGGLGQTDLDWVMLLQEIGYHGIPDSLSDAAYVIANMLAQLPAESGLAQVWLPRLVEGHARLSLGHPINPLVHDAELADLILLWHENEVHAVTPDQVSLTVNASIDQSRRLYQLDWTPSAESRVCGAEQGAAIWAETQNRAILAAAAQLLGLAQRMLDLGVDYAAQRKQFGKPIGAFQAVKHHLAEVAVKIEFATPVVHRAAHALSVGNPCTDVFVSHAKLAAGEAALLAARQSLQVHGAMGYTWEADLQMFMKRAWALNGAWGTRAFHKRRVADAVFADDAPLGPGATFAA